MPSLLIGPARRSRIGMPLAIVEIPDNCQPLRMPLRIGLPSWIGSGSVAFQEKLKMCVRSLSSTPSERDGSMGSSDEYSPPSDPVDFDRVYVPKYENLLLVWRLSVTCSEL